MRNLPFGYRIEKGKAVIDEEEAGRLKKLYEGYLEGLSLDAASGAAGIATSHAQAKKMLLNRNYLGTDFYPPLISREMMDRAAGEITRRAGALGRTHMPRAERKEEPVTQFRMLEARKSYRDPYRQAEYIYGMIREVKGNG